jgi:gamma-glutamyl:cysteine ligase YbdK (ATP-grasp superfamily)
MKAYKWLAGVVLIAAILGASLRAGDWMGARVVDAARRDTTPTEEDKVRALYEGWKTAHKGSVANLMDYYSPQARIVREWGANENFQQLKKLAAYVRQQKIFNDVRDVEYASVETVGNQIIVTARHRYGHTNQKFVPLAGQRRLAWQKINRRWLIVEDIFPRNYTNTN